MNRDGGWPDAGGNAKGPSGEGDGHQWVTQRRGHTFTTNATMRIIAMAHAFTDKAKGSHGISALILEKGTHRIHGREKEKKKETSWGMRASETSK